ncbi:MAG: L-rhamnose mutarotase, partial [Spirochaetota bacterium]
GLLFSYFEYHGDDIAADWAKMGECPHTQKWWKIMEPMQQPVEFCDSDEWWCTMTEVFHHE